MQLTNGLLLGESRLINLLFGVEHVEQGARAEVQILLLVQFAGAGAEGFLATLDLQRALQAHHLAAGFQQFLADIKARTLNGGLRRLHRVSGSVTPGVAPPSIQSQTIPFSASVQEITLNASSAITFSGVPASGVASMTLYITQGSSGGPFTVTWPAGTLWPGGTAPTLSTAAGAEDDIVLATVNGGTTWRGYLAGNGMAT